MIHLCKITLHIVLSGVLWSAISLGFMALSAWGMHVFWGGVKNAAARPQGRMRVYSLHEAWDELNDERWRFSQHLLSWLLGIVSMVITPIPPPQNIPFDAQVFGVAVIFVLFYLNLASGINTIRAVRDWRWKERFVLPDAAVRRRRTHEDHQEPT